MLVGVVEVFVAIPLGKLEKFVGINMQVRSAPLASIRGS